jgi:hypothetical protein
LVHKCKVQIQHRHIMPIADQAAGQLAADIAKSDKPDSHCRSPNRTPAGFAGIAALHQLKKCLPAPKIPASCNAPITCPGT